MSLKWMGEVAYPIWVIPETADQYKEGNMWKGFDTATGEYKIIGVEGDFLNSRVRYLMNKDLLYPLNKAYTDLGGLLLDQGQKSFCSFVDSEGIVRTLVRKGAKFRKIYYIDVRHQWCSGGLFSYLYTDYGVYKLFSEKTIKKIGFIDIGLTPIPVHFLMRYSNEKERSKILI